MKTSLPKWFPVVAFIAVLAAVLVGLWVVYQAGFKQATKLKNAEISTLNESFATARLQAAKAHADKLEKVLKQVQEKQRFAEELTNELANANAQLKAQQAQLKKGIGDAIKQDKAIGQCVPGLGPHSLQLYKHALGYSADQNG